MNIVIVSTDITGIGGTERTTSLLVNKFLEKGQQVSIISVFRTNGDPTYFIDPKIPIKYLIEKDYTMEMGKIGRAKRLLEARKNLKKLLKRERFDEIICQTFLPAFLFWSLGKAAKVTVCEHFKYELYNDMGIKIRNAIYKKCKRVVTLTPQDAEKFRKAGVKNYTIPNMVSFPIGENNGQESKRIVTAGRLMDQKGYDLLLGALPEVFKKHPDWMMEIYGKGELEEDLKAQARSLGIDKNVKFCGFSDDLPGVFRSAAFYVMSSRFEGFPMILLEAASQGLPIVSFDCPEGPAEILRNGGGILVEAENIAELSKGIINFIENPELRKKCAQKTLENISAYSPEEVYNKWITLFNTDK